MKVKLTKTIGFCMGVQKAISLVLSAIKQHNEPIYIYGPLIHNHQFLNLLANQGIKTINSIPPPNSLSTGIVIIRAHGVSPEEKKQLKQAGFKLVLDATCPRVKKVQIVTQNAAKQGANIIIVGDHNHPEVVGLLGYTQGRGYVLNQNKMIKELPNLTRIVVVAQTTQDENIFNKICQHLQKRFGTIEIHNETICESTRRRQYEIKQLIQKVEGIIVIGGRSSANTNRLFQLASANVKSSFLVETESDLNQIDLSQLKSIGVTTGTSTPNWIINKIVTNLKLLKSIHELRVYYFMRKLFYYITHSQLLISLGGAGATIASSLLQNIIPNWYQIGASFCYIYAMHHVINQFFLDNENKKNSLNWNLFFKAHHLLLKNYNFLLIILATCFLLRYKANISTLAIIILLLFFYFIFLSNNYIEYLKLYLKNIPSFKTINIVLIWLFSISITSAIINHQINFKTFLFSIYITILIFIRCTLFEILDIQSELIIFKKSIPFLLGKKKVFIY